MSLTLHCGAVEIQKSDVYNVVTPPSTPTHHPISHGRLLDAVEGQLRRDGGYELVKEAHSLTHDGARYFGVLDLIHKDGGNNDEFGFSVGIRNSHDRRFSAGLVAGTRVWICDNLAWSGDVKVSRKHTMHINRDIDRMIAAAMGRLGQHRVDSEQRIAAYKAVPCTDTEAHDMVIRAVDCKAISTQAIPKVLTEWRRPAHEAFESRNLWSLFNAFTEVYKSQSPEAVRRRSMPLHGLFDNHVGILSA